MICKFCFKTHAPTSDNFPLVLKENREVYKGKGVHRKSLGMQSVVVGFCCKWCLNDYKRHKFITKNNIVPDPTGRKTVNQMIREKL